ncbi:9302_t:CDS:10 [Ambispora leptoticha]|uniref:9302_t:CDS:1 n=1 Tax=Ambispora leptoticha TaxID=144679 RepID=A0A9N9BH45_9GLOM|nr:9302_t:CDS:10 [Ambispora leptoticha]
MANNSIFKLQQPAGTSFDLSDYPFKINDSIPEVPGDTRSDARKTVLLTTQLAVATSIGFLSFLLFCFLRPRWSTLFAPRTRLKGDIDRIAPTLLPDTFFGWVLPLIRMPESEVLDRVGLDAAVLLGFFKMSYKLFAFCGVFALLVIGPIKLYDYIQRKNGNNFFDDDPIKIPDEQNPLIGFSYALFTWVFSLASFYFLYYNYRAFVDVRRQYYLKLKDTLVARTVMVTVIPKELQSDRALAEFYESLGLGNVESAVVCRHVRKLKHAIERRTYYLQELEKAYVEWLGNPCTDPNYDEDKMLEEIEGSLPSMHSNREDEGLLESGHEMLKIETPRPTFRDGPFHIFGKKVDKINYYTQKLRYYDNLVDQGRHGRYTPTSVGFVTFEDFSSAQIAAQTLNHPEPFHCQTTLAPEPRDILAKYQLSRTRTDIPRCLHQRLTVFPWLANLAEKNEILKGLIQGSLPTLAVSVFNALLPIILDFLSKKQGLQARSYVELSTLSKFFFFLLVNVLLIFTIAGTIFKSLEDIITEPTKVAKILATTLPTVAPFFVNFVILEGIGIYPLQLLQFGDVVSTLMKRLFIAKTPRQYAEASTPPFLNYGIAYPRAVLIWVIILVYSAISPVILFFGAVYFFLGFFTFKYLLLYVYFHPYESAGQAWPLIFRRVIVGLVIFQLMMTGFLALQQDYWLASSITPLLIGTAVFTTYVSLAFNKSSEFLPLKLIRDEQNKHPTSTDDTEEDDSIPTRAPPNQATSEPPNTGFQNTNNDDSIVQSSSASFSAHKHREILDDDLYQAEPDLYTDYTQPPMTLYPGILNTGMRRYGPPALVGILPWVWLPVKRNQDDIKSTPGFFRGLLGMHKKGEKPSSTEGEEESPAQPISDHEGSQLRRKNSQILALQRDEAAQEDPNNPNKTYYHHPERRKTRQATMRIRPIPEDINEGSTSTSREPIVESPVTNSFNNSETHTPPRPSPLRQASNPSRRVSQYLENWAGNNFGGEAMNDGSVGNSN